MERLGIIGGTAFAHVGAPEGTESRMVPTDRGDVRVHVGDGFVFLRRHGDSRYRLAHEVRHKAHVTALETLGVRQVVAFCSVGSLHDRLPPGTVVVPDDYLSLLAPPTTADGERLHIVPALDPELRAKVVALARRVADDLEVHDGGVYAETRGPRFETRAEVRLLADYADVVGMTGASEATLLQERGIASAILAIVDNYAHGIGTAPLTLDAFDAQIERNAVRTRTLMTALMKENRWSS